MTPAIITGLVLLAVLGIVYRLGYTMGYNTGRASGWVSSRRIMCPKCGEVQQAAVTWSYPDPYASHIHECTACGYIITESEWNEVGE